jgi:hypothetical protein
MVSSGHRRADIAGRRSVDTEIRGTATPLRSLYGESRLDRMPEQRLPEPEQPTPAVDEEEPTSTRPTVDEMSEWSFPASDPPATWTWDIERPFRG